MEDYSPSPKKEGNSPEKERRKSRAAPPERELFGLGFSQRKSVCSSAASPAGGRSMTTPLTSGSLASIASPLASPSRALSHTSSSYVDGLDGVIPSTTRGGGRRVNLLHRGIPHTSSDFFAFDLFDGSVSRCPLGRDAFNTALHRRWLMASVQCDFFEMKRLLFRDKSLINNVDPFNTSALHWASKFGNVAVIQLLIDHRCDLNVTTWEGSTALHIAYIFDQESARCLLESQRGVNAAHKDINGLIPREYRKIIPQVNSPVVCPAVSLGLRVSRIDRVKSIFIRRGPSLDPSLYSTGVSRFSLVKR